MKKEQAAKYEISSEEFTTFTINVFKGKVVWCSDDSHPVGADFKSLKNYYETRQYKCFVKKVKDENVLHQDTGSGPENREIM